MEGDLFRRMTVCVDHVTVAGATIAIVTVAGVARGDRFLRWHLVWSGRSLHEGRDLVLE